jgi:acetylornithine/succinyldiaminopimelate/putrescine aminotransferase
VARTALRVIVEERLTERSEELGNWALEELRRIRHPDIREIRGRGLLIGMEPTAPALIISREDLAWMTGRISAAFIARGPLEPRG